MENNPSPFGVDPVIKSHNNQLYEVEQVNESELPEQKPIEQAQEEVKVEEKKGFWAKLFSGFGK